MRDGGSPWRRVAALLHKELEELRRGPTVLLPSALTLLVTTAMSFVVAIVIPATTGERLDEASDIVAAAEAAARTVPGLAVLAGEARAQAFILTQFFLMQIVVPMVGAMAIATNSVIGEKQARTLEPLLATPMTTAELLAAKTLGAFLPSLVVSLLGLALYVGLAAALAEPGVWRVLLNGHTAAAALVLGPTASLAGLLLGVIASSRVNDARTAQQLGVLIVLPITGLFVAQVSLGTLFGRGTLLGLAGLLLLLDVALLRIGVRVFDRERILTRWT
jgi:ABC-2 type transport system permease protein